MRTVPFAPVAAAASFASSSSSSSKENKKNNNKKKIIFYTHSLCPYAHRVRLCLDELNLLHTATDIVDIDLSNKPDWYLKKTNGRGLVPMIEFTETGECVRESLRINERLWETFETNEDREEEEEEQQLQQHLEKKDVSRPDESVDDFHLRSDTCCDETVRVYDRLAHGV